MALLLRILLLLYVNHEETQAFSFIAHPLQRSKTWRSSTTSASSSSSSFVTSRRIVLHLSSTKRNEAAISLKDSNNRDEEEETVGGGGVRLNKAFQATHSRRQADRLIQDGRVCVNGKKPSTMGIRLFPGDVVTLDDERVYWEHRPRTMAHNNNYNNNSNIGGGTIDSTTTTTTVVKSKTPQQHLQHHVYIKYWKPRGVECTTDQRVRNNIIDALGEIPGVEHRLWPMGRLDKDSTGLILLTSDGITTQRVLKSSSSISSSSNDDDNDNDKNSGNSRRHRHRRHWKTYWVETDKRATDEDLQKLSQGVRILAPTSRDGNNKIQWVTTRTDATITRRYPSLQKNTHNDNNEANNNNNSTRRLLQNQLIFTICEGKNRQIRRMCETVGLTVVKLHRVEFAGITLDQCPHPGSWAFLTNDELNRLLLWQDDDD